MKQGVPYSSEAEGNSQVQESKEVMTKGPGAEEVLHEEPSPGKGKR